MAKNGERIRVVERANEPAPQVATLIHREVMDQFRFDEKDVLSNFIGTEIFIQFCAKQQKCVEVDMTQVQSRIDLSVEHQFQLVKDLRLIWRFWTDLMRFAEDQKQHNRAQNMEYEQ